MQLVADIMEIADQRHVDTAFGQAVADMRNGCGRLVAVDGNADKFGAGGGQGGDLCHRGIDIRRVGIGHRLNDDRCVAADGHMADLDRHARAARHRS